MNQALGTGSIGVPQPGPRHGGFGATPERAVHHSEPANALSQLVGQHTLLANQPIAVLPLMGLAQSAYTVRVALAEGSVTEWLVVE